MEYLMCKPGQLKLQVTLLQICFRTNEMLPGHSKSLHVLECSVSPLQSVAGVTPSLKARHDLQRVCDPELQEREQVDQVPQVDHAPTASVKTCYLIYNCGCLWLW